MAYFTEILNIAGPLLGVIVGALTTYFVKKKSFQAEVVAKSREKWIADLRESIAEFLTLAGTVGSCNETGYVDSEFVTRIQRLTFLRTKIELMLNPEEGRHQKLVDLADEVVNAAQSASESQIREMAQPYQELSNVSQRVLKTEWEKVKDEL